MSIDIANESGVEVDEAGLAAVARFALERLRIHPLAELSVLIVDEQHRELGQRVNPQLVEREPGDRG